MRYSCAILLWLLPCALFSGQGDNYAQAETSVQQTLKELLPPTGTAFAFTQTTKQLAHLTKPWQTWHRTKAGTFSVEDRPFSFYQIDSVTSGSKVYTSFKYFSDTTIAVIDYGEHEPGKSTLKERDNFLYEVSDLTPIFLLKDFLANDRDRSFLRYVVGPVDTLVYKRDDGTIVSIIMDPVAREVRSALFLTSDDLYGNVTTILNFGEYVASDDGRFKYPSAIVDSMLGFDASVASVTLSRQPFDKSRVTSLIPSDYRLAEEPPKQETDMEITRTDYNPHIHLLDLKHTQDKVLIVEFRDYLLVAEAPLNSKNGEMIIDKAHEIAPDKPIRYFVFGHYHPHYIGGIRAFVHNGSTILATPIDSAYVRQLTTFSHSLDPDSLEIAPRPLKLEIFENEKVISDGEIEMRIVHIGAISRHTEDYLVYYFPKYKLLFEDDLAWIADDRPLTAAGDRQKGLYDAIKLHNLDVETIIQGWPVRNGVKSIIDFAELRKSVEMIPPPK